MVLGIEIGCTNAAVLPYSKLGLTPGSDPLQKRGSSHKCRSVIDIEVGGHTVVRKYHNALVKLAASLKLIYRSIDLEYTI